MSKECTVEINNWGPLLFEGPHHARNDIHDTQGYTNGDDTNTRPT